MTRLFPIAAACGLAVTLSASLALALPQNLTGEASDRGASVTLRVWDQAIEGDSNSRCSVGVVVSGDSQGGSDHAFTSGDTVEVKVYEHDILFGLFDDLLWQDELVVTEEEVRNQTLNRIMDCGADFGDDSGDTYEIYATVVVNKDVCGLICNSEDARTASLTVSIVTDDVHENDNSQNAASTLALARQEETGELVGQSADRIVADEDWILIEFDQAAQLDIEIQHVARFGAINGLLFDEEGNTVAQSEDAETLSRVLLSDAAPGLYALRVSPRMAADLNFYDLSVRVNDAECSPGDEETTQCGNCGQRSRLCGDDRRWTPFGPCQAEGECRPGDERSTSCGNCGSSTETCNDTCTWENSQACQGEGECARGAQESEVCEGGTQVRTCDNNCAWREFGPCQGDECETGDTRDCYTGPDGTLDVGICAQGREVCNLGRWGECEGEVGPSTEQCGDQRDNDCDGLVDQDDAQDCATFADLGEACNTDTDCASAWICLRDRFTDGYCSAVGCGSDADCTDDGVCAEVDGQNLCLRACQRDSQCRRGYLCTPTDAGSACAPRCRLDRDCASQGGTVCDSVSGRCVDREPPGNNNTGDPDMGNPDPDMGGQDPDMGQPPASTPPAPKDEGCTTNPGKPNKSKGLLIAMLGLLWGARRARRAGEASNK